MPEHTPLELCRAAATSSNLQDFLTQTAGIVAGYAGTSGGVLVAYDGDRVAGVGVAGADGRVRALARRMARSRPRANGYPADATVVRLLSDGRIVGAVGTVAGDEPGLRLRRTVEEFGTGLADALSVMMRLYGQDRDRPVTSAKPMAAVRDDVADAPSVHEYPPTPPSTGNPEGDPQSVSTSIPGAIYQYLVTAEGEHSLISISKSAEKVFGFAVDQLRSPERLFAGVHPDDREAFFEAVEQSLSTLSVWDHEYRTVRSDGSVIWIHGRSVPRRLEDGSVLWDGMLMEVTAEKTAEAARRKSEARLQSIIGALPDMMFELSSEGVIEAYWGGVRDDLFLPPEKFVGRRVHDVESADLVDKTMAAVRSVLSKGGLEEFQYSVHVGGTEEHYEARTVKVDADRAICIIRRITDRVVAERELADRERQLVQLNRRLQQIRERERSELARDIHDTVGQSLTALSFDLEWLLKQDMPVAAAKRMRRMLQQVDDLDGEVKRIGTLLRPRVLDDLGIGAALQWLADDFSTRYEVGCLYRAESGDVSYASEVETTLFRIAQEALTNAARHSRASEVSVVLAEEEDSIRMTIADNGVGFSPSEAFDDSQPVPHGIDGMRERARALAGDLEIHPGPDGGTVVVVILLKAQT